MLSPKIIYFDSMKNLTCALKNMNITDSLKASVFYLDEILQVVAFGGLGEDQNISLATDRLTDYSFRGQMNISMIGRTKDNVAAR